MSSPTRPWWRSQGLSGKGIQETEQTPKPGGRENSLRAARDRGTTEEGLQEEENASQGDGLDLNRDGRERFRVKTTAGPSVSGGLCNGRTRQKDRKGSLLSGVFYGRSSTQKHSY